VGKWKIPFIKDYSLKPTPYTLERFIRAMQPWPVAWTEIKLKTKQSLPLRGKRLKIIKAYLEDGKLVLDEVQLEGKNPVSWKQFKAGHETVMFE
jgi:methionyl-tRNA formyltransferase